MVADLFLKCHILTYSSNGQPLHAYYYKNNNTEFNRNDPNLCLKVRVCVCVCVCLYHCVKPCMTSEND
jgi:hypothetical protein